MSFGLEFYLPVFLLFNKKTTFEQHFGDNCAITLSFAVQTDMLS